MRSAHCSCFQLWLVCSIVCSLSVLRVARLETRQEVLTAPRCLNWTTKRHACFAIRRSLISLPRISADYALSQSVFKQLDGSDNNRRNFAGRAGRNGEVTTASKPLQLLGKHALCLAWALRRVWPAFEDFAADKRYVM